MNSVAIDVDEIDELLADSDKDTPGHSTRTVMGVGRESWRACMASWALNYEAQINKNRLEYETEKATLDIMNRAKTFKGKVRTRRRKGPKRR